MCLVTRKICQTNDLRLMGPDPRSDLAGARSGETLSRALGIFLVRKRMDLGKGRDVCALISGLEPLGGWARSVTGNVKGQPDVEPW